MLGLVLEIAKNDPILAEKIYNQKVLVHAVPALCIFINVYLTRVTINSSDWKYTMYIGLIYIYVNFHCVYFYNSPFYPFMPWKDYKSLIAAAIVIFVEVLSYLGVCKLMYKLI